MKEAFLHMLFVGAVLFAASFLKKNTTAPEAQTHRIEIDSNFQRKADVAPTVAMVGDTTKLRRRK